MTGTASHASPTFAEAARRVQHRLAVRKGLEWLLKTWPYAAALAVVLAGARLLGMAGISWGVAALAMLLWIAGCFGFAFWRRAESYAALAFWDKAAARGDAFANAWWFEHQADDKRSSGQQLHLAAQQAKLPEALPLLPRDVALPDVRWLPLLPVCALGLMFIPVSGDATYSDPVLSAEAREVAKEQAKKLADRKLDADRMQALTAQEKSEVEKLQAKVRDTAKGLEQQESKTAREVLGELERRARDAEQLAEKLGAGDAAWASAEMVAEMRKHADTAALGDAVANKAPDPSAKEAQSLADKLKSFELTLETRDRLTETLRDIGKQAQPGDKDRTVGQHVISADKHMAQTLPQDASREFQALADKMRTLAAREKAREQLEKLAEQLREAGSKVAGQGTEGMQQLAGSQQNQQGKGASGAQGQQSQGMQNLANAPQMQPMQMPGMGNGMQMEQLPQGKGQGQTMQMLRPSEGNGKDGKQMALVPGDGKSGKPPKSDDPMLFAPIPGDDPNQSPSGAVMSMAPGMSPAGSDPGNGTTKMGNSPTEKTKAAQSATANAQRTAEGRSTVRTIEGQAREEQGKRTAQATAIDAIAAEEGALDEAALPNARKEQVRRYFTELRKRFEAEP
jgi:hypothetical protein